MKKKFLKNKGDFFAIFLIFLSIIFFFIIVSLRINNFTLESGDTAVAEQALWNTIHGDLFRQSFLNNQINLIEHLNFIQFIYLPFYWLFPSLYTLYILIGIFYGIASIFLYRYTEKKIGFYSSIIILICFLFNPIVVLTNIGAMHVVAIGAPLFLISLIFYEQKKYYPWLIFLLLTNFTTEFIAPTIFVFGILAFIEKRSWKWFLPPIIISSLMYIASIIFIKIGFAENKSILKSFQISEIAKNNFSRRLLMLEEFFRPGIYLTPFFSKYSLLFLPTIILTLFVINKGRLSSGSHLFTLIPVILVFSIIDILIKKPQLKKIILSLLIIGIFISIPIYIKKIKDIEKPKRIKELKEAVSMVKDGGSVTASRNISYHLAKRSEFYLTDNQVLTDYIILDTSFWDSKRKNNSYLNLAINSEKYQIAMDKNDVLVLIKNEKMEKINNLK